MADQAIPSEDADTETDSEETAAEVHEETPSEVENPEISTLKEQNAALLSDLQRVQAEFDNFRRQNAKRQADLVEQAGGTLAEKLLPVLDACDAGIQQGLEDVIPIRNALIETLQGEGLEVVADSGVEFDPECHEAIMHEAKEDSDKTTVDEIMRSGYLWKGRTIRPAMVRTIGPA
jgi:molecular chaperone GrpE